MSILGGAPKATLVAPRDRSYARRKARGRMGLSRCARGILVIAFNACCGPIPLRCAYGGSAGSVLRSQEGSGEDWAFALCARSFGVRFQGLLRTDPAPLGVWGLRGIGPALAEEALGRMGLSRFARGALVFASKACSGPIPLRCAYGGSAGTVLRALRKLWGGGAFALCAGGFGVRFQSLLRTDPAAAGGGLGFLGS
jgi:hypothetical protein